MDKTTAVHRVIHSPSRRRPGRIAAWALAGVAALAPIEAGAMPASFPPDSAWTPVLIKGFPMIDPEGDTPGPRDIVGDAANPMLYLASDTVHIYFRLRLDDDPLQSATNFTPYGWGCYINTDSNVQTYEFSTIVNGNNNPDDISFYKNTVTVILNSPNDTPDMPAVELVQSPLMPMVQHARVVSAPSMFGGTPDFFIDWAVERSSALAAGFDPSKPAGYYCGSSVGNTIDSDCSGGTQNGCLLSSQFSDPVSCGTSGCGVCGDGEIGGQEACDDGNLANGDGCDNQCLRELGQPCTLSTQCASWFCDPASNTCACDQDADCPGGQLCKTSTNPNTCVDPGCGNGVLEAGEACEDGNLTSGDGCNAQCLRELGQPCTLSSQCASGRCDPANNTCACDEDSDCPMGKLCNTISNPNTCVAPGCGNGVPEPTEGCDDGNLMGGDGCNAACLKELGQPCTASGQCASGFCDPANNTCACDHDADCPAGQQCNTLLDPNQCVPPGCGNGVLEPTEGCDDGNLTTGDGCNAQCLREIGKPCTSSVVCASGFCDPANNTCACDQDADCSGGKLCNTSTDPNTCVAPGCGNGVLEPAEGCDDGNLVIGDGCDAQCLLELGKPCTSNMVCASGLCDPASDTCACNQNADCPAGQLCNTSTDPNTCVAPGCGNGVHEPTEGCDDNNLVNGDGCDAACMLELGASCTADSACASGLCDPTSGTCTCDEDSDCPAGQICNMAADPNVCAPSGCGNGVLEPTEGCDDGNLVSGDGCDAKCLLELGQPCQDSPECATGVCDPVDGICACDEDTDCPAGQICDMSASPHMCVDSLCGNGKVEIGEGCDDQNTIPGDGCSAACALEPGWTCVGAPSLCKQNPQCIKDTDCAGLQICDVGAGVCIDVQCTLDSDCPSGEACDVSKHACSPTESVYAMGGGCACRTGSAPSSSSDGALLCLVGLLGLAVRRARRRT